MTKNERLEIFLKKLEAAPPARSHEDAYRLLCDTLSAVEDEFSGIPYDVEKSMTDGRLYPPLEDNKREVEGHPGTFNYRSKFHVTRIGPTGSIEILETDTNFTILSKPGAAAPSLPNT